MAQNMNQYGMQTDEFGEGGAMARESSGAMARGDKPTVVDSLREEAVPLLGGAAMLLIGLKRQSTLGLMMIAAGGGLLYRHLKDKNLNVQKNFEQIRSGALKKNGKQFIELEETVVVEGPVSEVYDFWCNFENFPRFMHHLDTIVKTGNRRSHWEATIPGIDKTIDWDAEMTETRENELIRWNSLPDADIYNEGTVRFRDLGNGNTEVHVRICYKPPAGAIGQTVAQFLNAIPANFIKKDMERFKEICESELLVKRGFAGGLDTLDTGMSP